MRLSHEAYVEHVRADADRIATVAGRGLEPAVPSCPGWTVRDAVEHTAEVYRHKIACMREKAFPDPWPPLRGDQPTLECFEQAAEELLAELSARDPREFAATWWWDERTVGFWGRMACWRAIPSRSIDGYGVAVRMRTSRGRAMPK